MSLDNLKAGIISLVVIALLVSALAMAQDAFQDDLDENNCATGTDSWNGSHCISSDGATNQTPYSAAYNATQEGLIGTANASSYLSTIGTLIGVAALISIVVGAFMFVRR